MNWQSARLSTVVAAVVTGAAIVAANPPGRPPTSPAGETFSAPEEVDPGLEERSHQISTRIAYKETLVRELVAGRVTLDDVSSEFMRLAADDPMYLGMLRAGFPGAGDDERAARNVLEYVARRPLLPAEAARVWDRLDGEFARRFGCRPSGSGDAGPRPVG